MMTLKEKMKNIIILDDIQKLQQPINEVVGYEYIIAQNGVFVRAENNFFKVCICIAECEIRNLKPCEEFFEMKNGKIPLDICEQIKNEIECSPNKEKFLQIVLHNGEYIIFVPEQRDSETAVKYESELKDVILEVHSHPNMDAFFSSIDNDDEKGFRLYGVFSVINGKVADFVVRISVYGHYKVLHYTEIAEEN